MYKQNKIDYKLMIALILLLNSIDLFLTFVGLELGYFVEGNVLMNDLYYYNKIYFVGLKIVIMTFFTWVCLRYYDKLTLRIKRTLIIPFGVYLYIFLLHILTIYYVII